MEFFERKPLNIIEEDEFTEKIKEVEEILSKHRISGYFSGAHNVKIFYEYFLCDNAKANVVIVHGLSEFTKKYYEAAYYFLGQGYNVFLYDQRCHGLSDRLTPKTELIHVDDFDDYVTDLDIYIDEVVLKAQNKPVFLYAHSMGGAVACLYISKYGKKINRAVLSAPMIEPSTGKTPVFLARIFMKLEVLKGLGKTQWKFSKEFNPQHPFKGSSDASEARFNYNLKMRRENLCYQSTPMTSGWVYNSLILKKRLYRIAAGIDTPMLILSAQNDTVVNNRAQFEFERKCDSCEILTIKDAKHSMLTGGSKIMKKHLNLVFVFFGG